LTNLKCLPANSSEPRALPAPCGRSRRPYGFFFLSRPTRPPAAVVLPRLLEKIEVELANKKLGLTRKRRLLQTRRIDPRVAHAKPHHLAAPIETLVVDTTDEYTGTCR